MNKKLVLCFILILAAVSASGLEFSLRPGGFVFFPAGQGNEAADGNERFDIGGGGGLGFDVDFASLWPNPLGLGYTAGIEGELISTPYKSPASGNAQIYSFGGVLGLYYFPLSRLFTRIDGGIGVYQGVIEEGRGKPGFRWRIGGGAGFRFTPMFTLAADVGWRQFQSGTGGVFNSGFYTGLALHVTFETERGLNTGGVGAVFVQDDGVYPAFLSLYRRSPAGTVTIRNNENAEIREVRASFRAAGYTASEFPCGAVPLVAKGRSVELPLYADFSPDLLGFTDAGGILGEVVIRYRFLGKEKQSVQTVAVRVHNRNVFAVLTPSAQGKEEGGETEVWRGDPAGLAAFVTPAAPAILEYAKRVTGLARSGLRTGLNRNMQFAVWLFEGLRAGGVRLDGNRAVNNEVQFPAETLGFRTGNRMDTGLLWAAVLEAAGIPSALVPLDGDFIVAYSLGIGRTEAELLFNGLDRVLVVDDQVWMPLSMNAFNGGFLTAWDGGVEALDAVFARGAEADFIMPEKEWGTYPPAPLPATGGAALRAGAEELAQRADGIMRQYIAREIRPLTEALQRQIAAGPAEAARREPAAGLPPAVLYNRLGILLVRSGREPEAATAYERAAGMGSVPAMVNRGNLALIGKDYGTAERWFRQALEGEPENRAALRGMELVEEKRE